MLRQKGKAGAQQKQPAANGKKLDQILPQKEQSNFRAAIKLFELKQYKKGYKSADAISKKHPKNAEVLALKGLFLNHLDRNPEADGEFNKAFANDTESPMAWQLYGIAKRNEKNYEEACKALTKSLQLDPQNPNLLRDLSSLYVQLRQYPEAITVRHKILQQNPEYRPFWTGLAVVQYLNGNYSAAEGTLSKFESLLKKAPPKMDFENSEVLFFRNLAIYKQGDIQKALDHLESIADRTCDPLAVMEFKAQYLLELGRHKEAEREYRALIKRNSDDPKYYPKLEQALKIDASDVAVRKILYNNLALKYPRSDVPKSIFLELATGAEFKSAVHKYLREKIIRGVPCTFVLVKAFYKDTEKKAAIQEVIFELEKELGGEGSVNTTAILWVYYYISQHYNIIGENDKALEYISKCFEKAPSTIEFYLTKARILKHAGDLKGAADVLNEARLSDTSDRFINSKTVKYRLRADQYSEAVLAESIFTHNDSHNVGLRDMVFIQTLWAIIEHAELHARRGDDGFALKRYDDLFKTFYEIYTDEFDFHGFCMRKGTVRSYFDMIEFSDSVYAHPTYLRAVSGAAKIYFKVHDDLVARELKQKKIDVLEDATAKKTAVDALQKDDEAVSKAQADKKAELQAELLHIQKICTEAADARHAIAPPKPNALHKDGKMDSDAFGFEQLATKEPLETLFKHWKRLSDQVPTKLSTWELGFEIYLRQHKYVLALQVLSSKVKAVSDPVPDSWIAQRATRLRAAVESDEENAINPPPPAIKVLVGRSLPAVYPGVQEAVDLRAFYNKHVLGTDPSRDELFDWIEGLKTVESDKAAYTKSVETALFKYKPTTVKETVKVLNILKAIGSNRAEEYTSTAKKQWPLETVF